MNADHSIRPLTAEEIYAREQAEAIESDLAYSRWKTNGGPLRDNDARAFALQQQYAGLCLPEGQA